MERYTIENWLVLDYKKGTTRTRKSEPSPSNLGRNEIATPIEVEVSVPEPEVEPLTARVEAPAAVLEEADVADLDADDARDWRDVADDLLDDVDADAISLDSGRPDRLAVHRVRDCVTVDTLQVAPGAPDPDDVRAYAESALKDMIRDAAEGDDA